MSTSELQFEFEPPRRKIHFIWITFFLLALLFHALLFMIQVDLLPTASKPKVDLQEIDPKKLEAIRKKWKEKSLLLDKNQSLPTSKETSPEARYLSDRNIRFEKEQRARNTDVMPNRTSSQSNTSKSSEQKSGAKSKTQGKSFPDLAHLGIPFHLDQPTQKRQSASEESLSALTQSATGDQALLDRNIATGSENLLNTQESIYYSFYARIYEAIGPVWQSRIRSISHRTSVRPGEYITQVDVVLDQNGAVLEVRKLRSSGVDEFDRAIEDAWGKVGPFPNPPKALLDVNHQIHTGWTFNVNVQQGIGIQEGPPIRDY